MRTKTKRNWMIALALGVSWLSLVGCSSLTGKAADTVTIVGKNFTEQDILTELVGTMLEKNTGLHVKTKPYLGGTDVCFSALKTGSADVYVEYTGTGLVNIMGEPVLTDPDQAYEKVQAAFPSKYGIEWLKPIGFNNTYAVAVTDETARKYNLKSVSDLQKHAGEIVFGTEQEFLDRPDGLKGLTETYGLNFQDVKAMDPGLKYQALTSGKVNAIDAFTTDGRLIQNHLVLLQDDKHFFPPYYAAPIVRQEALRAHPEIAEQLNRLAGKIDEAQMAKLNAEIDVDKKQARAVAESWLKQQGLISN